MRALLKVMSTNKPSARDINDLLIKTRELNKKVPKGQNLLGSFGFNNIDFGIDNLEDMGLPKSGDLVKDVKGVPNIKTNFGKYINLFSMGNQLNVSKYRVIQKY